MEAINNIMHEQLQVLDYRIGDAINGAIALQSLSPCVEVATLQVPNVSVDILDKAAHITGGDVLKTRIPSLLFSNQFASTSFYVGRHEIVLMSK